MILRKKLLTFARAEHRFGVLARRLFPLARQTEYGFVAKAFPQAFLLKSIFAPCLDPATIVARNHIIEQVLPLQTVMDATQAS